ncbi:hypothetical protein BC834DRAFT_609455 [Gloeopeniophorella convolvens]|nr:hypothetical protein BC834DRAFT_609455 [Gloeopeniophorella convolvens]
MQIARVAEPSPHSPSPLLRRCRTCALFKRAPRPVKSFVGIKTMYLRRTNAARLPRIDCTFNSYGRCISLGLVKLQPQLRRSEKIQHKGGTKRSVPSSFSSKLRGAAATKVATMSKKNDMVRRIVSSFVQEFGGLVSSDAGDCSALKDGPPLYSKTRPILGHVGAVLELLVS